MFLVNVHYLAFIIPYSVRKNKHNEGEVSAVHKLQTLNNKQFMSTGNLLTAKYIAILQSIETKSGNVRMYVLAL